MLGRIILLTERSPQQSMLWRYLYEEHQDLVVISPAERTLAEQLGAPEVRLVLYECSDEDSLAERLVASIRNVVRAPLLVWGPADNELLVIKALRAGADGYLPETYTRAETLAALEAHWRRHWQWGEPLAETTPEELMLQSPSHSVIVGNKQIRLTPTEFRILEYLAKQEGRIVPREELALHLWETPEAVDAVNFHVCYLRKKLEPDPHRPKFIRTKWGGGYYLAKAGRQASS